jgi:hypothetical protein
VVFVEQLDGLDTFRAGVHQLPLSFWHNDLSIAQERTLGLEPSPNQHTDLSVMPMETFQPCAAACASPAEAFDHTSSY